MRRRAFLALAGAAGLLATAATKPCPPNNPHCRPIPTTTTTTIIGGPASGGLWSDIWSASW
jgi:hypothetical protein